MKKLVTGMAAGALLLGLTGCGEAPKKEAAAEAPKAADTAFEAVVGFMYGGPVEDGGWNQEHEKGRAALEAAGTKTMFKDNVEYNQSCERVMENLIHQGANVIVGSTFGYMDYMVKMSKKYPEVTFLHCGGYISGPNMHNYTGRMYQARFLSGMISAAQTKTKKLGYIAAFEIPEVVRGINAFTLGAQSVCPDIKVSVRWTHTWYDPAIEKEAGKSLIEEGCDVLTEHESAMTSLLPAEEAGVYSVGYTADFSKVLPNSQLTSVMWDWEKYFVPLIAALNDGTYEPCNYWGGFSDGVVKLAPLNKVVTEETAALVAERKAQLMDGTFKVFAGPLYNQAGELVIGEGKALEDGDLLGMSYFVKGIEGVLK